MTAPAAMKLDEFSALARRIENEVATIIVGQQEVVLVRHPALTRLVCAELEPSNAARIRNAASQSRTQSMLISTIARSGVLMRRDIRGNWHARDENGETAWCGDEGSQADAAAFKAGAAARAQAGESPERGHHQVRALGEAGDRSAGQIGFDGRVEVAGSG